MAAGAGTRYDGSKHDKMTIWKKDDISKIEDYDFLTKQEVHFIIHQDRSVSYKIFQDDQLIEYQKKYVEKVTNIDVIVKQTLIGFYVIDTLGKKTFIRRAIFPNEKAKSLYFNYYIDFIRSALKAKKKGKGPHKKHKIRISPY